MDAEIGDWEVLHHQPDFPPDEIESPSPLIQPDYFSLDSLNRYNLHDSEDNRSAVSDNPSWIDPENSTPYLHKESTEFWSDSSSDRSEDRNNFTHFLLSNQMAFYNTHKGEKGDQMLQVGRIEAIENSDNELELPAENRDERGDGNGNDKKGVVWWKMPMEFLSYFVFRMSPVWTVSVAAAVMGFVILGRRLYKMKKKNTRGLQIKVAIDDKKVSQVMSRAARLNEAFSIVKRVPAIRPALPAIGSANWPAMTIR